MSARLPNIRCVAPNQSRWTKRYTDAQKTAILRACLIEGNGPREAAARARAGQLGIPAFEIHDYAYQIVRDGRDTFEARDETALDLAIDEAIRQDALTALRHDRALRAGFKAGQSDPEALKRSARALAEIKRARRDATREGTRSQGKTTKPAAAGDNDVNTPRETTTVTDLLNLVPDRPLNPAASDAESGSLTDAPNT